MSVSCIYFDINYCYRKQQTVNLNVLLWKLELYFMSNNLQVIVCLLQSEHHSFSLLHKQFVI